jgi:hypothetical protein
MMVANWYRRRQALALDVRRLRGQGYRFSRNRPAGGQSISRLPTASAISANSRMPMSDPEVQKQAARCMDCGIPYCHGPTGCPVHNQIPDWNDLVYNGNWEGGDPQPAFDQQLPGIHRPRLPRTLRGSLHAEPRGHARSPSRPSSRRSPTRPMREGWIVPKPATTEDRQEDRRHRFRPGRHGGRTAACPRRPRGACLRA